MQREVFVVEKERFDLSDEKIYHLQGTWPKEHTAAAELDGKSLEVNLKQQERISALERFQDLDLVDAIRVQMEIVLPDKLEQYKKLVVYAKENGKKEVWFSIPVKQLIRRQGMPQYFIESSEVDRKLGICRVRGWAAYTKPLKVYLENSRGNRIPCEIQHLKRVDVQNQYPEAEVEEKCGFFFELHYQQLKEFYIVFEAGSIRVRRQIHLQPVQLAAEKMNEYCKKGSRYLKLHGPAALAQKVVGKVKNKNKAAVIYQKWLPKHLPSKAELEHQRKEHFSWEPTFSVVVPLYKTPEKYLRALVESLQAQTYGKWELCLSDGSGADSPIRELLKQLQTEESRIKVIDHQEQLQISENTNAAIEAATGEFVVFADHDDELTAHALYECVKVLNEKPETEVLYSDEDKMTMDGHKFFQPHFKPDYNVDLLCTVNYICHLFVAKKTLIDEVGMLRREFDGAQDYDFIFRCVEHARAERIHHIPKILYHWRCHEDSTSENPESKLYAFEAGRRAIEAHYSRIGVPAAVENAAFYGMYRTKYDWKEKPLVSIIIPNKDHRKDLETCVNSILEKTTYPNIEFIIVENNSTEQETFDYYKDLETMRENVHVVFYEGGFNYSKINNFGADAAKGSYLLLLNNDTEMIDGGAIGEMLGYCMRGDVGIVGAKLLYEDETIQHAGVVLGFGGTAGHAFIGKPRYDTGYFGRILCAQDYSAVTAACMMVKRSVFDEVGGLTEELAVAFNDIDFCLKVRKTGKLVVYDPYAEWFHYESKSRGYEDSPEKVERFNDEVDTLLRSWREIIEQGDPYYNPNLTLDNSDFSLRK